MRMITACFARALQRCTSRICVHFLLTFPEVMPISKTRNQLSEKSHGFRLGRSCHTALDDIKHKWTGTKWFIEFDIEGFFDNIDHKILMQLLEKKIDDVKFLRVIKKMLEAGYMEDWKFHKSLSGTPQGGIITLPTKWQTWC